MAAFAGLNAFSSLREQRSSQMRHPVHLAASALIGGPFLRVVKVSLSPIGLLISQPMVDNSLLYEISWLKDIFLPIIRSKWLIWLPLWMSELFILFCFNLRSLKEEDIEQLIGALSDFEVDVQDGKQKVRIYVE